ncbi:MAG: hypothetical protein GY851_04450 [bacterium]|nr:hypothetical protein [bacterium]
MRLMQLALLFMVVVMTSCGGTPDTGEDPQVTSLGSVEVTAELIEIPGELIDRPMYHYAHIMKYKILTVHRGDISAETTIFVGHYDPIKTRAQAAKDAEGDSGVGQLGGNVKRFRVGDVHRMALEVPIDDHYMGAMVNEYFEKTDEPIHWAVWTNRAAG